MTVIFDVNFVAHFMRPLHTYDLNDGQDVELAPGRPASAQIQFNWKDNERVTGTTLVI